MTSDEAAYRRLAEPAYRGAFVARYDALRPPPPSDLIALLAQLAPARPPRLVVDLGSGTGISTVAWAEHAERVIGIEQNAEMLAAAREAPNVEYRHAKAHRTGLPDACADVVTCAQSFHWMARGPTLEEVARILRAGGVFAAYDYDWPPIVDWEVDAAFRAVIAASGVDPARPEKSDHMQRLEASGRFRATREFFVHAHTTADAGHLISLPHAFGPISRRLSERATAEELGLDRYQHVVERRLGGRSVDLWWSYRVRSGFK
jgi:SAM-dependent methyltransferase